MEQLCKEEKSEVEVRLRLSLADLVPKVLEACVHLIKMRRYISVKNKVVISIMVPFISGNTISVCNSELLLKACSA